MSFFSRLFKKKKNDTTQIERPQECLEYIGLKAFMDSFIQGDHYVAKSEYRSRLFDYKKTVEFFGVLKNSGTLKVYCKENGLSDLEVLQTLSRYDSFESIIDSQNERFVRFKMDSEKKYLDDILVACDPMIKLDDDQRKVVLTDEDYCLVVAGAGAGKTTTVAAKVKYLVIPFLKDLIRYYSQLTVNIKTRIISHTI